MGIKIYALLGESTKHQCVVIVLDWQDISCKNCRYKV
jgi:hypothetical protein